VKFISVAPHLPRGANVFVPAAAIEPGQEETLRRIGSRLGFRMAKVIDLKTGAILHYTNLERGLHAGTAGSFLYSVCIQIFGWEPGTQLSCICTGSVYID
jgi:hypothetical protein